MSIKFQILLDDRVVAETDVIAVVMILVQELSLKRPTSLVSVRTVEEYAEVSP